MIASGLLIATLTGVRPLAIALVAVWGLGFGAVPAAARSWTAPAMPDSAEGVLALFVSAQHGSPVAAAVGATGSLILPGRAGASITSPPAGAQRTR